MGSRVTCFWLAGAVLALLSGRIAEASDKPPYEVNEGYRVDLEKDEAAKELLAEHRCTWYKQINSVKKIKKSINISDLAEDDRKRLFPLGYAICCKTNTNPQEHKHEQCQDKLCYQHRDMPRKATLTQGHVKETMRQIAGKLGLKIGIKKIVEVTVEGSYQHTWKDSVGTTPTARSSCRILTKKKGTYSVKPPFQAAFTMAARSSQSCRTMET